MRTRAGTWPDDSLVSLAEISEIELVILKRMRAYTMGEHRSRVHGTGHDLVGLREWQAGDRASAVDWPQSSLTSFSPLLVRDFDQPSTAAVVVVADRSGSTRCGVDGRLVAGAIARAVATIGMSAVFFQDSFGLVAFDDGFASVEAVRPRIGKGQVLHCLDAYERRAPGEALRPGETLSQTLGGFLRQTTLVPVVSDFLFEHAGAVLRELALLDTAHDVFLGIVDAAFAYEVPPLASGWVEAYDVETRRARLLSRRGLARLAERVRAWQDEVEHLARELDLDVVRLPPDPAQADLALVEFAVERRLRKVT